MTYAGMNLHNLRQIAANDPQQRDAIVAEIRSRMARHPDHATKLKREAALIAYIEHLAAPAAPKATPKPKAAPAPDAMLAIVAALNAQADVLARIATKLGA